MPRSFAQSHRTHTMPDQAIAILAGGRSSRMGTDKSFVPLLGKTLIQHVLDRVRVLDLPIILITNRPDDYRPLGLPLFSDVLPDKGALGGLYTALTYSPAAYTLCVACDMPFLNADLLRFLLDQRAGHDVIVPRINGFPEAMHAVYRKNCLPAMWERLKQNRLKAISFYGRMRVHFVEEATVRQYDPDLRSFVNINTPEELARIRGD